MQQLTMRFRRSRTLRHREAVAHRRAREVVTGAIRRGELVRGPCAVCGTTDGVHAHHHEGYDDPLRVQWLCPAHHREAHGRRAVAPPRPHHHGPRPLRGIALRHVLARQARDAMPKRTGLDMLRRLLTGNP